MIQILMWTEMQLLQLLQTTWFDNLLDTSAEMQLQSLHGAISINLQLSHFFTADLAISCKEKHILWSKHRDLTGKFSLCSGGKHLQQAFNWVPIDQALGQTVNCNVKGQGVVVSYSWLISTDWWWAVDRWKPGVKLSLIVKLPRSNGRQSVN